MIRQVRSEVAERIQSLKAKSPRFQPQLVIIQAGARPDSSVYVRMKAKAAEEVGIKFQHVTLPEETAVEEVVGVVKKLNDDPTVSGILVQLPLGSHVGSDGERAVTEAVSPEKDVDGYAYFAPTRSITMLICGYSVSTHTTSVTCLLAPRSLSSRPAPPRALSSFWTTLVSRLPVPMLPFSVVAILSEAPLLLCSGAAMLLSLSATVALRTCRKSYASRFCYIRY